MKAAFALVLMFLSALYMAGCTCPSCTLPTPSPEPNPTVTKPSGSPYNIHIVKRGETLWRISKRYGVNLHDLMAVNHIEDPSHLIAGTRLIIPSSTYKKVESTAPVSTRRPPATAREGFIWPVRGKVITFFGRTKSKVSKGIDIQAPLGANVKATQSGKVIFSGEYGPFGKTVILQHSRGFSSVYAHNRENLVKVGQWVRQGQTVATVGMSGHASHPILHFEIRKKSTAVDPLIYLRSQ